MDSRGPPPFCATRWRRRDGFNGETAHSRGGVLGAGLPARVWLGVECVETCDGCFKRDGAADMNSPTAGQVLSESTNTYIAAG